MHKPWQNNSGLPDPTAYEAIENLDEEEKRVSQFIKSVKTLAKLSGFEIVNYITVRVSKTGHTY